MSAYKPSLIERETIILFNEAESEAEIYTYNQKLITMLKKSPEIAKLKRSDDTGAYTFIVPKSKLKIRLKQKMPEKNRKILLENLEKANQVAISRGIRKQTNTE